MTSSSSCCRRNRRCVPAAARVPCRARPLLLRQPLLLLLLLASALAHSKALLDPRPGSAVDWWSSGTREQQQQQQQQRVGSKEGVARQALTGGSGLDNNHVVWCSNPSLPGCQSCPNLAHGCGACWFQFPDANGSSFVLDPTTKHCDCPPGYGLLPQPQPPVWSGPSRHLLLQLAASANSSSSSSSSGDIVDISAGPARTTASMTSDSSGNSSSPLTAKLAHLFAHGMMRHWHQPPAEVVMQQSGLLPAWAANCMPCPVDYFSSGGQQGFARCLPCPGSFTTAGAVAAANCMTPYCGPGQEPTRNNGGCRPCPFGTYSGASASTQSCAPCPANFTTPARGSTSYRDCRVPICRPGQYLDIDLFVCRNCTGNSVSRGGVRANGPFQPGCAECALGSVANETRAVCYSQAGTCPTPDTFRVTCNGTSLPSSNVTCGPGDKALSISQLCTAYPVGSVLDTMRAIWVSLPVLAVPPLEEAASPIQTLAGPKIMCPAGAFGGAKLWPVISSFNGLTNCRCSCTQQVSCYFSTSSCALSTCIVRDPFLQSQCLLSDPYAVQDKQQASLQILLDVLSGSNNSYGLVSTQIATVPLLYLGISAGYCAPQPPIIRASNDSSAGGFNYVNPLQVNCTPKAYISRVALTVPPAWPWAGNGMLPQARSLPGLSQLNTLVCSSCSLDGTLPRDWGTSHNLMELRYLDLPGNTFTGTLPETWGYLVNLVNITLSSAVSLGRIPRGWGNMRSLQFVNFTGLVLDDAACAPQAWREFNGLVLGETLLMPGSQDFCIS